MRMEDLAHQHLMFSILSIFHYFDSLSAILKLCVILSAISTYEGDEDICHNLDWVPRPPSSPSRTHGQAAKRTGQSFTPMLKWVEYNFLSQNHGFASGDEPLDFRQGSNIVIWKTHWKHHISEMSQIINSTHNLCVMCCYEMHLNLNLNNRAS